MKRYVVGTLLLSIVMFVQLFGNIPVFADTFVPTSSYDFTSLADLGYALIGGAEFDFEGSPYVIDDYNSLSAEQKEIKKSLAARQFLKDYMESRNIAFEENGELQPGSAYYTIAFGLAGQEFFEAFQTASAAEQEDLEYSMPISPSRFADWAQYNKYWFNRYANDFVDDSSIDPIVPDPPLDYVTLIGLANSSQNGFGFFWNEYPLVRSVSSTYNFEFSSNYIEHSWYRFNNNFIEFPNRSYNTDYTFPSSGILTLNIVSVNDQYIGTISGIDSFQCGYLVRKSDDYVASDYICGCNFTSNTTTCNVATGINGTLQSSFSYSDSTIYNVLSYFVHRFRNINIYVNGDCWALVSNPAPANPTIPDFPDIINQETGELAYDIAMPKTSDYSGSFDLTSLFDAIRESIAGASDGDLATGSTIGSLDVGRTYTGENIDINDRVIDLTSSRVFDGTLTDDTTGRLPRPPVVPPAVSAGLGGVTVLAKYVDATQCILPEDLMTAFWGCVWILIILGLIKNLHR